MVVYTEPTVSWVLGTNERTNKQPAKQQLFLPTRLQFFCILFYTKWFCISLLWLWSSSSLLYLITTPNYLYTNTLSEEQAGSRMDRQTDRPYSFISSSLMFPSFLLCLALFFALVVIVRTTTNNVDDTRTHIHFPQKYTWRKEVLHYFVFLVVAIVFLCYPTLESLLLSFRVVLCWHFLLLDFEGNNFYVLWIILWLWKEINVLSIDMNKSTKRRNRSHFFLL